MKRFLLYIGLFIGLSAVPVLAADNPIFPAGPVYTLNLQWGISSGNGFNNNFYFTPLSNIESVCIYVYNNNPTNPHTFTATISNTGNPGNRTPSDGTWTLSSGIANGNLAVFPSPPTILSAAVAGVANVSLNLSNSSVAGGSPDTATVIVAQTNTSCFSTVPSQASTFLSTADSLQQSFGASNTVVNPAATSAGSVLALQNGQGVVASTKKLYFDKVIIDCTATCSALISTVNAGSTCTIFVGEFNTTIANSTAPSAVVTQPSTCGTPPTITNTVFSIPILANTPTVVDLTGILTNSGNTQGLEFGVSAALTGSMSVTIFWHEK